MIIDDKDKKIFKIIRELKNERQPNYQKLESILNYQKLQRGSLEKCGIEINPILIIYNQQEGNYEVYKIKIKQNDEKQEIDYRPKMYN